MIWRSFKTGLEGVCKTEREGASGQDFEGVKTGRRGLQDRTWRSYEAAFKTVFGGVPRQVQKGFEAELGGLQHRTWRALR
ncbi:unnamed protein product, partial [Nesidiocoris tenuis]